MDGDDFRLPPSDIEAEQCVLGAMLLSANAAATAAGHLSQSDFLRPQHRAVFKAAADLYRRGNPVDVVSVRAELERTGTIGQAGGPIYLVELSHVVPTAANADFYIGRVRELGTKRAVVEEFTRLVQMAYHPDADADELIDTAEAVTGQLRLAGSDDEIEGLSTMGAFINEGDTEHEWLVPGLLEAMDRVIVVASEGAGKTTLARQMAVQLAAGVHPFAWTERIDPVRTLYVDLENPPPLIRRKVRHLHALAARTDGWDDGRCWRFTRPGGIDLRKPHDQHLLDRVIREARPQIMFLGPLYKSFTDGGERAEQLNMQVAQILDRFRARYGLALWLETHAPMEQGGSRALRPLGSGVWSRWPEFGLSLRKDSSNPRRVRLERFRGDRDERAWPHYLERSTPWPWAAGWAGGYPVEEATGA
jgi:hypothetical protein